MTVELLGHSLFLGLPLVTLVVTVDRFLLPPAVFESSSCFMSLPTFGGVSHLFLVILVKRYVVGVLILVLDY